MKRTFTTRKKEAEWAGKKHKKQLTPKRTYKDAHTSYEDFFFNTTPVKIFKKDTKAPDAYKMSKGERAVSDYLKQCGVKFTREQKFKWLVNPLTGQQLRLDFYMGNYTTAIEFDGKQHFERSKRFDDKEHSLEYRQTKDLLKDRLCRENNVMVIRLSYKDINNVPQVLFSYGIMKKQ